MPASPWWHGAVLYQLYVRSWRDSDGDGYGDIRGILAGLGHLSWLGVDGIWLSPTMPSPDEDWGYDVSNYTAVHPELGSMADLDELIASAARAGIKVLLDLVPNHTSSAHPWFIDAASARDSAHRDYYVWADAAPGGGPPNNWLDATGQSAWEWHAPTGQYYLHNFLVGQPDLNWWLPAVHAEFRDILEFWFDRGVAGFRIDVAHGLYKDAELRDNPPLRSGSRLDGRFGLRPVYNSSRPETHSVFRDWRKIADSYGPPRLLLGETWVGDLPRLASYYGSNDELQLAFNFPFAFASFEMPGIAQVVSDTLTALPPGACPVWTGSNHDIGRFPSRWCQGDERLIRLALLVLTTLPGTTVLYYGDEIGMTDVDVPPELRRDAMTRDAANPLGIRDRGRTPMRWDDSPGAGFTEDGVRPWLPLPPRSAPNVAAQRADIGSTLWLCKQLIALRHAEIGAEVPQLELLPGPAGLLAYRVGALVVAANLSGQPAEVPAQASQLLLATDGTAELPAVLAPSQGIVAHSRR
jgi:alpha-glucosidase